MNEYKDTDTDWVVEAQNGDSAKWSYVPGLARIAGGDPSTGAYQYQLRDRLGSVRDIRSQAKARLAEYTFEPYGDVWSASGLALNQGFTGHTWDAAAGMYHTAYRQYSPGMARWISRDPLGMVDGPNLYGYVGGDPVNFWDLLGLTMVSKEEGLCVLKKAHERDGIPYGSKYAHPQSDPHLTCDQLVRDSYKDALGTDLPKGRATDLLKDPNLREVQDPQPGDIVAWDPRHVGLYDPDHSDGDTLSATTSKGVRNLPWQKLKMGKPRFYRYDKPTPPVSQGQEKKGECK